MSARHLDVGRIGEDAAAELLAAKGLRILGRNVVLGRLELDLICEDGDTLVFVEVKTRAEGSLGSPADGLTRRKCACLFRAAQAYLSANDLWSRPSRFDFVSVFFRAGKVARAEHVEDVLRADEFARSGGRTSTWQPW